MNWETSRWRQDLGGGWASRWWSWWDELGPLCRDLCMKTGSWDFIFMYVGIYLFIYGLLGLCCCTWAFSSCGKHGLVSSCWMWASHCGGLSCCRAWALGCVGLSSCNTQVQLPHNMWRTLIPGPGIEAMSPALPGGFLTTGPVGKSKTWS